MCPLGLQQTWTTQISNDTFGSFHIRLMGRTPLELFEQMIAPDKLIWSIMLTTVIASSDDNPMATIKDSSGVCACTSVLVAGKAPYREVHLCQEVSDSNCKITYSVPGSAKFMSCPSLNAQRVIFTSVITTPVTYTVVYTPETATALYETADCDDSLSSRVLEAGVTVTLELESPYVLLLGGSGVDATASDFDVVATTSVVGGDVIEREPESETPSNDLTNTWLTITDSNALGCDEVCAELIANGGGYRGDIIACLDNSAGTCRINYEGNTAIARQECNGNVALRLVPPIIQSGLYKLTGQRDYGDTTPCQYNVYRDAQCPLDDNAEPTTNFVIGHQTYITSVILQNPWLVLTPTSDTTCLTRALPSTMTGTVWGSAFGTQTYVIDNAHKMVYTFFSLVSLTLSLLF
eukprot:Blabericola_migrator_1__11731@NODE_709_length_6776_cov_105_801908_g514_i0_p3_GENE_NODE_709_length_6776_cov_105_801908_g514_i0NODE_709_length_6776_cov_105_801908_g514_i0_p3_ORF_typecomplete_len407_score65_06_NODE_709_length_6776_cov_105_801908_g514_i013472567